MSEEKEWAECTEGTGSPRSKKKSCSDSLVAIARAGCLEFFHDAEGDGYADVDLDGRRATYAIRSKAFKTWLISDN